MSKATARMLLIILILVAAAMACSWDDCTDCNGNGIIDRYETGGASPVNENVQGHIAAQTAAAGNATAEYGEEQFHAQLTEIAK